MNYTFQVRTTGVFDKWFQNLRDRQARIRIQIRIDRLEQGNPGDMKSVGSGISEMRIDHGPGYRVYFHQRGPTIVLLLCGGDKSTQQSDIDKARAIAACLDME